MQSPAPPPRPSLPARTATALRRARRTVLVRRRPLAAGLAALAVLAVVRGTAAPSVPTTGVLVAASDLAAGRTLQPGDLTTHDLPTAVVPDGSTPPEELGALAGRTLAAPVRRGEPLTDLRVVSPSLLEGYPGLVAVPVRVADAGAVRLLRVGDRVDLLATDADGAGSTLVAADAPVVALPRSGSADGGLVGGGLVVVAVPETVSRVLARSAVTSVLSVVLTG